MDQSKINDRWTKEVDRLVLKRLFNDLRSLLSMNFSPQTLNFTQARDRYNLDHIWIIFFQSLVSFCTVFVAFYLLHEFTTARQMLGAKKYIQDKTYQFKQGLNDKYQVKYICFSTVPSSIFCMIVASFLSLAWGCCPNSYIFDRRNFREKFFGNFFISPKILGSFHLVA